MSEQAYHYVCTYVHMRVGHVVITHDWQTALDWVNREPIEPGDSTFIESKLCYCSEEEKRPQSEEAR